MPDSVDADFSGTCALPGRFPTLSEIRLDLGYAKYFIAKW